MRALVLLFGVLVLLATACDKGETGSDESGEAAEGEATSEEAATPTEPAEVDRSPEGLVLARVTLPTMGHSMLLPEGYTTSHESETGAGYNFELENYRSLMFGLEANGATDADNARSLAPIVAGGLTVTEVTTLPNGNHLVLFEARASDGMQAVAVFSATHYVKCMGPEAYLPRLREMCESITAD